MEHGEKWDQLYMIFPIKGTLFACLINCFTQNIQGCSFLKFVKAFRQECKTVY